jgi:hypothetical protein
MMDWIAKHLTFGCGKPHVLWHGRESLAQSRYLDPIKAVRPLLRSVLVDYNVGILCGM